MADPAVVLAVASGIGGVLVAGTRELWSYFRKRTEGESVAKDQVIAVLQSENAIKDRSIMRLGERLDETNAQLEKERLQTLGVAYRMRQDSQIDETEFEADMPTAVRDMADIVAPKKSLPPGVEEEVKTFNSDMRSTPPKGYKSPIGGPPRPSPRKR